MVYPRWVGGLRVPIQKMVIGVGTTVTAGAAAVAAAAATTAPLLKRRHGDLSHRLIAVTN